MHAPNWPAWADIASMVCWAALRRAMLATFDTRMAPFWAPACARKEQQENRACEDHGLTRKARYDSKHAPMFC
jgi:hypothetical protein